MRPDGQAAETKKICVCLPSVTCGMWLTVFLPIGYGAIYGEERCTSTAVCMEWGLRWKVRKLLIFDGKCSEI